MDDWDSPNGSRAYSPRVLYDPISTRWYASGVDDPTTGQRYLIAVSISSDPTDGWKGYEIANTSTAFAAAPMLGIDQNSLYITANNVGGTTTGLLVVPKADLIAGGPTLPNAVQLANVATTTTTGLGNQPIVDYTGTGTTHLTLSSFSDTTLRFTTISGIVNGPGNNPSIGSTTSVTVVGNTNTQPAAQLGSPNTIDTGDARFGGHVIKQGNFLWAVNNNTVSGRNALKWYRFNATTLAVDGSGTIGDAATDYYNGSIAVNAKGDVVIGYTRSSANEYASSYVSVGFFNGTSTTFASPTLLKAGTAYYDYTPFDGTTNRWGNYSQTVLDPIDTNTFWTVQQWASDTSTWESQVSQIRIQAQPTNVTSMVANGSYTVGAVIPIDVVFDTPVVVDTSGGTPSLALNSGGTATYATGSGSSTLTFNYTVAASENSFDLDYTANMALTLNNGTITTQSNGTTAVLTLPAPNAAGSLGFNKNIVIDTVAPAVSQYLVVYGTSNLTFDLATLTGGRTILPWLVKGVQVAFSEPIATGNLASLSGITATGFAGLNSSTLNWTFPALADGTYNTAILGTGANAIKDAAGNPLGGGMNFTKMFQVLYGDVNGDGIVNASDMAQVSINSSSPNALFVFADLDGNGTVNINDYREVRKRIGRTLPPLP